MWFWSCEWMWSRPKTGLICVFSFVLFIFCFFSNQNCFSFKFRQILFNPWKLIIQRRSLINSTVMVWWLRQILFQTFYWILSFLETYFQVNTSHRLLFHTAVSLWIQLNWISVVVREIESLARKKHLSNLSCCMYV